MSMIHRCVVCDKRIKNQYAPSPCCDGYTCPKERKQ